MGFLSSFPPTVTLVLMVLATELSTEPGLVTPQPIKINPIKAEIVIATILFISSSLQMQAAHYRCNGLMRCSTCIRFSRVWRLHLVRLWMKLRHKLEYAPVWLLVHAIGILPRSLARAAGIVLAYKMYFLMPRLRRVGMRNLGLAFPEKTRRQQKKI